MVGKLCRPGLAVFLLCLADQLSIFSPGTTEARRRVLFPVAAAPAFCQTCKIRSNWQLRPAMPRPGSSHPCKGQPWAGSLFRGPAISSRCLLRSARRLPPWPVLTWGRSQLGPHWRGPCTPQRGARGWYPPTPHCRGWGAGNPRAALESPACGSERPRESGPALKRPPPPSRLGP